MARTLKSGVAGIAFLMLACGFAAAQDIKTNYIPGTDFSKYKTYKWVTIQGAEQADQILDQQIKLAVDTALGAKGLTKSNDENADLYVGYQVSITQQEQWNAYGTGGGWRFRGGGMATMSSTTIQIGTLGLDFYDPSPQQLLWRGQASKTLNPSNDPKKNQERLNKAVAKLLKKFPPK